MLKKLNSTKNTKNKHLNIKRNTNKATQQTLILENLKGVELMEEQPKKGTTNVGLLCSDGVIIGAERKATMGSLIANKEAQKVFKITDSIVMSIAGGVGDAQRLIKVLRAQCALYEIQRKKKISVESAATLLANILQNNKFFPYYVQLLIGGYDTQPRLFSVDAFGGLLPEKSVATGSGSPVAYGVIEDKYEEGRTVKENIPTAVKALKSATERDIYSGGTGFDIAIINKKGIRMLEKKEIQQYLKKE